MRNVAKQSTLEGRPSLLKSNSGSTAGFKLSKSDTPSKSTNEERLPREPARKSYALLIFGGWAGLVLALLLLGQFLNSSMWTRVQAWPAQVAESWNKPAPQVDTPQSRDAPAAPPQVAVEPRQISCGGSSSNAFGGPQAAIQAYVNVLSGTLGKVLTLLLLLTSAAIAVVKNNPMPVITGVASAAFISFGPTVILGVFGCA